MEKYHKISQEKQRRTPIRLQGGGIVIALTTTLAGPQMDAAGIEFYQEDVRPAPFGVLVQGKPGVACHPGVANVVHLCKDRQLSFAVRRRCAWNLKEKLREKPIKQRKKKCFKLQKL